MSASTYDLGRSTAALLRAMLKHNQPPSNISVRLHDIQGNVLGGFNKSFQRAIWCTISDYSKLRWWSAENSKIVASARETTDFKALHKRLAARRVGHRSPLESVWVNISFSPVACHRLGFDVPFDGRLEEVLFGEDLGHVLLLVGADSKERLQEESDRIVSSLRGAIPVRIDDGVARRGVHVDQEHFGFRDGITRPLVVGVDDADERVEHWPHDQQGRWTLPGAFVFGYPRAALKSAESPDHRRAEISRGPTNGSLMVYWKLQQDVDAFAKFLEASVEILARVSAEETWTPSRVAALVMGRAYAGELTKDAAVANELGCPFASHIHKASPRGEDWIASEGGVSAQQILRRGIPYGSESESDKGLLFICYQTSLAKQFERIVGSWMSNPDFPVNGVGVDLFIGAMLANMRGTSASLTCPVRLPNGAITEVSLTVEKPFVRSCYGGYFFVPAISALAALSG